MVDPHQFPPRLSNRQFSPYELNQLQKYGLTENELLAAGECPVEYLTGFVTFGPWEFQVDASVLIPRVETEELVQHVQAEAASRPTSRPLRVIELGTGSGAIGLSLAKHWQTDARPVQLTLTDISPAAVALAKTNAERLELDLQDLEFAVGDLWSAVQPDAQFDLIVANLPYVPTSRVSQLPASVKDFEPALALDGGPLGLTIIKQCLAGLDDHIAPQGVIWLEVDETHHHDQLVADYPQLVGQTFNDVFGRPRFIRIALTKHS